MSHGCMIVSNYSTASFTYDAAARRFVTDASDLGWKPGSFARHMRLQNPRTQQSVLFSICGMDDAGWRYRGSCPDGRPVTVLVVNS